MARLLSVESLRTQFATSAGPVRAVDGLSFAIDRGEVLGLVGESGCGKSVTSLSIMRLVPPPGAIVGGHIRLDGNDLLDKDAEAMRRVRGARIGMVFQEPMTSLNPVFTIGDQIAAAVLAHAGGSRRAAWERAVEMLDHVQVPSPRERARDYPHQLSGGLRQRAMIALALAPGPQLLIADEPTTALDVTIQAQILDLLRRLQAERGMAVLLIKRAAAPLHARLAAVPAAPEPVRPTALVDRRSAAGSATGRRRMPVRSALPARAGAVSPRRARARREKTRARRRLPRGHGVMATPLLDVRGLEKRFAVGGAWMSGRRRVIHAVDGVSFTIERGEVLGLVGESGCGKSTTARLILRLIEPSAGSIRFEGHDLVALSPPRLWATRQRMQIVFQDPFASLNPRMRVGSIIAEPLAIYDRAGTAERQRRVGDLLEVVGLDPAFASRYPHELSGGQRQRIGIAAALALRPSLIVADEPVSALDVSVQAQVLNLLMALRRTFGLTYLFISHDLHVVLHMSDRVAVMYLGEIVEIGPRDALHRAPQHPYTQVLLSAVPVADPTLRRERIVPKGEVASPLAMPAGCRFHPRCPFAFDRCRVERPVLRSVNAGHEAACHLHDGR